MTQELLDRIPVREFESVARLVLDTPIFEWVRAGAGDEQSTTDNVRAFRRWRMRPRVLVDVSEVRLATTLQGTDVGVPLIVAPMALQRVLHPDGEIETARAAAAAGAVFIVAVNATVAVEEIARSVPDATLWLQLYNWDDRPAMERVIARAEEAGCKAIVPLVNTPIGVNHTPPQVGFRLPAGVRFAHFDTSPGLEASNTWSYLEWIAGRTSLPLVPKGIMRGDDARRAVDHGASGIIVSNHGGRQLNRSLATLDALQDVVGAVPQEVEVYLDGGVRSGSDALTALALGARGVLVGRPVAWGLALGGARGVGRVLQSMRDELAEDAALCGIADVNDVPSDIVARVPGGA